MEAIIRTNDRNLFNSLLPFLKSLNISIETNEVKKQLPKNEPIKSKKKRIDLKSFSFYQSMEATKGMKGSLSDAVIEERRSE